MGQFSGKSAIVTGGSSGIGREIALRLAAEGAVVTVANRTAESGAAVVREIEAAGGKAHAFPCDVRIESSVQAMVDGVVETAGCVDILIAASGIMVRAPISEMSVEDFRAVVDTNLTGSFLLARAVAPHLRNRKAGKIVLFGSTAAVIGYAAGAAYGSSKAGVIALTRTLAAELARDGINVNCISPGGTVTAINAVIRDANPNADSGLAGLNPSGRGFMMPEDIAGAALFLCSDAATSIHGHNLVIDEGFTAVKPV